MHFLSFLADDNKFHDQSWINRMKNSNKNISLISNRLAGNYNYSLIFNMKNYSFSNIAAEDSYNARNANDRSALYRHSELKATDTNSRIEEIKKKYDTPTRRERIESLSRSRDNRIENKFSAKEQAKQNLAYSKEARLNVKDSYLNHHPAPSFGGNHLKESFAVNRIQKNTLKNDLNSKGLDCIRNNEISYFKTRDEKENSVYPFKYQTQEDEEIIFSKVREMKQSIINNDYMRGSINPRSSVSSANYQIGESKQDFGRQSDPRVENIDKINAKIKQILSCLAQGQKNPSKFVKDSPSLAIRQKSLDVGKVQNSKGSYLRGDRSNSNHESIIQSQFFGRKSRQNSQNFNTFKNLQKDTQKLQIQTKKDEGYYKYKNNDAQNLASSLTKGDRELIADKKLETKVTREADRLASKQYRDYSANKIDSYVQRRGIYSREQQLVKTPSYVHNKHFEAKSVNSQSRSHIDSIKKSTITNNQKTDVLKSGKKLNDQISKIQKKIEEFQAQKKKLNIQFTPFSMKNRSSSNLAAGARFQLPTLQKTEQRSKNELNISSNVQSSNSAKDNQYHYNQNRAGENSNITREKQLSKQLAKNFKNSSHDGQQSKFQTNNLESRLDKVEVGAVKIEKNNHINQDNRFNHHSQNHNKNEPEIPKSSISQFDEAALRKRTDEGIQQRKKRLQSADQIIKTDSLKRLVSLFCQQAKIDQNFRNMKIWLESNFSRDKFATISRILSQSGTKITPAQCQLLFKVQQSEHNPFFTNQDFSGSLQTLCKAYNQARDHWQSKIRNKFDRQSLIKEGFTVHKIDLERKGFIELQDLVRLLNIQSGTFYRNRDLFLIYRRFTRGEKVSFEDILREISI